MAYGIGVEWINNYNNLNQLTHEHEDAGGFYDELVNHDGWIGRLQLGRRQRLGGRLQSAAPKAATPTSGSRPATSSTSPGHGSPCGFYFRSDTPDDSLGGRRLRLGRAGTTATCGSGRATSSGWPRGVQHAAARRHDRRRESRRLRPVGRRVRRPAHHPQLHHRRASTSRRPAATSRRDRRSVAQRRLRVAVVVPAATRSRSSTRGS